MANYRRRFTRDEFAQELFAHLRDMPHGHLQSPDKLERNAQWKAEHYSRALDALDAAMERVRRIAASHPELQAREEAETAVQEINAAIEAYGEAAMSGNSSWSDIYNNDPR